MEDEMETREYIGVRFHNGMPEEKLLQAQRRRLQDLGFLAVQRLSTRFLKIIFNFCCLES